MHRKGRIKNPRKATGSDFIPLKVIKFASNVIMQLDVRMQ